MTENKKFAVVSWNADDVRLAVTDVGCEVSDNEAEDILSFYEDDIENSMIIAGAGILQEAVETWLREQGRLSDDE